MTDDDLVDAEARRRVAADLGATLFVEAGAGSGKTTALVERIAALVESGAAPLTGIAAITFTEAAAAELRLKVRRELESRAQHTGGEAAPRLEEALARIDEAPISTIHGFCRRVLSAHPIEAGLPPRFEVLDEISESIEWRRRFGHELDLLAATPAASEVISLAWLLDVTAWRIEALARALEVEWHRWAPAPGGLERALRRIEEITGPRLEELGKAIDTALAELARCSDPADRLARRLEELAALGSRISSPAWPTGLEAVLSTAPFGSVQRRGEQQNWAGGIEEVRSLAAEAQRIHGSLRQLVLDEILLGLTAHFQHRAQLAAQERRCRGVLTFHDLLVFCRTLLASQPAALSALRRQFTYVLIDEFQDTDSLQLEIARLIGAEGSRWASGRFFFVGDPKQSIYRFRGADLEAYESARQEIVGDGALLLTSNFRSVPGILSFVNGAFAELLGERFRPLDAVRHAEPGATPPVSLVGGAMSERPTRAVQRQIEAEDCCRAIELAVYEERWPVAEGERRRPARLGDIAVLVPRRTGLPELEAAFEAHEIAYRVESASLVLQSQEVRDVLHLARAIGEPGNELALVATLRSPCYSIGDDELVAWASAGGRWSIEADRPSAAFEAAPAVGAALSSIAGFRDHLRHLGPAGTLSLAVRERRLLSLVAGTPRAREAWRRIRYVIERARLFVEAGGESLSELADWIDEQLERGARSAESLVPEDDEDVVRIMTVHGAKGLEFPITVLCGFGTTDESGRPDLVLRHEDGRAEVHFKSDLRSSGYEALELRQQRLETEEALRLCYVAATRARDHLVVCAHHAPGRRQSLGERLHEAARGLAPLWRRLPSLLDDEGPVSLPRAEHRPPVVVDGLGIETVEELEAWVRRRGERVERSARRANVPATEVSALRGLTASPGAGFAKDEVEEEDEVVLPPARRKGRAATRTGRAVHATLQSLSLRDAALLARGGPGSGPADERLRAIATAQARAERLEGGGSQVARLAGAALKSPVVAAAFATGRARRELYVATEIEGTVLDGYVDLCFEEPDGTLSVVDYKTDSVSDRAAAAERAASYELQAASYALCLEEASGRRVGRCVLVFLSPPREPIEHELSGSSLEERKQEVRRLIAAAR